MKNAIKSGRWYVTCKTRFTCKRIILPLLAVALCYGKTAFCQPPDMSKLSVHLLLNTNPGSANTADGCVILYSNSFTAGLGPEDSYKFTNLDENLALPCGNTMLSVDGRSSVKIENDTIALKIWQYRQTNYYLQFTPTNFPPNVTAILKDNYLQQDQDISLTGMTDINFSLTADTLSTAVDRFCIVLKPAATLSIGLLSFSAAQKENGVQLQWSAGNEMEMDHYEVEKATNAVSFCKIGNVVASATTSGHQLFDNKLTTGDNYYRIKAVGKAGGMQLSKMIKVTAAKRIPEINIYPNPVKGNVIGLQLNNLEQDTYSFRLYNTAGQPVYATVIKHNGGNTQQVTVNKYLTKGNYTLVLSNGKTTFNKTVIIN